MLPAAVMNLTFGLFLFFSTSAIASPVLTIFCKSQTYGESSRLSTFPSDVRATYFAPDLEFKDENAQPFRNIFEGQPYAGDDLKIQLLVRAQTQDGKVGLYRSSAHVGRRLASNQLLAKSRSLPENLLTDLKEKDFGTSLMAQKGNTFVFAGAGSDEFLIYDLISQATRSVHLQPLLANPRFSVSGNYLFFDLFNQKTYRWQQVAYDFNSFKVVFTTPASNLESISLEYNQTRKNWVWLEFDPRSLAASLVESNSNNNSNNKSSLVKINSHLSRPLIYSNLETGLKVYWVETSFTPGKGASGQAHSLLLELNSSSANAWPLPEILLTELKDSLPEHLMSGGFKAPQNDEIYFSLYSKGGLISLNTTTGLWRLIATFYPCLEPHWTFQGPPQ